MQVLIVEFLGTLMLVLAWLWTHANPYIVALTYLFILVLGGPVSGAHYHPLITGAHWALGRMPSRLAVQYGLAQLAGACIAVVATPVLGTNGLSLEA